VTPQADLPSTSGEQFHPPVPTPPKPVAEQSLRPSIPKGHAFGVPIGELVAQENVTLPPIVAQCVVAVEQFGLRTEGIYRVSGSASTLAKLKHLFDF
jgi:Rho GTPase-activating protein RGD1